MKHFNLFLSAGLLLALLLPKGSLKAQDNPPADAPVITVSVVENATIKLGFKAPVNNTPVWVETSPGVYTKLTVGPATHWADASLSSFTAVGTTIRVHGSITAFRCRNNHFGAPNYVSKIVDIDARNHSLLVELDCSSNYSFSLRVSGCTNLTRLLCQNNKFPSLDLTGCSKIKTIYAYNNRLTSLDLSPLAQLEFINIESSYSLTSLTLGSKPKLTELSCTKSNLTGLDLRGCTALKKVTLLDGNFTSQALDAIYCGLPSRNATDNATFYAASSPAVIASSGSILTGKSWKLLKSGSDQPITTTGTANCSGIPTYTLTYTAGANGSITGTTPQSSIVHGTNGTPVTAVASTGYRFTQWSDTKTDNPRTDANVTADISVVAQFEANTYTVSFNANGGSGTMADQAFTYGVSQALATNTFTRMGHTFAGWSTVAGGGGTSYTNGESVSNLTAEHNATVTLYAQWTINTYTLTYTAGANGTITGTTPQTVNHGESGTAVTAVASTGYRFTQWSDTKTDNPRTEVNVTADISVVAQFEANTYTVSFNANGGSGTMADQSFTYGIAQNLTANAYTRTGYTFAGWNTQANGGGTAYTDAQSVSNLTDVHNATVTLYAQWTVNTYTLTYAAGANGTIAGNTTQTVNHGESGTAVTAVANPGYQFKRWSDGSTANPRTDANVTANIAVTAEFELAAVNTYTLTYVAGENGTIRGELVQTVAHGGSGTAVIALPNEGYQFKRWSDGGTANPRTDGNVTADITVTAEFEVKPATYTLTYIAGENGTIRGELVQTVAHGGGGRDVTAVPNEGYRFKGWSDGSTANPRTDENVTADITVTAEFEVKPATYTLTYTAGVNGIISGTATQTVNHGESGTAVTAVANAGYRFKEWSDGSVANPRTDENVAADIAVTAQFESTTGVGSESARLLTLYPNPFLHGFYIDTDSGEQQVRVFNAVGVEVLQLRINGKTYVDLSAQPNGIYIVRVGHRTVRLVKR